MFRSVMEHHLMRWITQENGSAVLESQNACFPLDAQISGDLRNFGCPFDQGGRLMGVQIVANNVPALDFRISGDECLDMGQKVGLVTRRSAGWSQDQPCHDISTDDQGQGSMTL